MPRPFDVGVGIALMVLDDVGHVLMKKRKGAHGSGTWGFIGGWVDKTDGSLQYACVREGREEAKLKLEPDSMQWHYNSTELYPDMDVRTVTIFMKCKLPSGQVPKVGERDKQEGEWIWVGPDSMPKPLFAAGVKEALDKLWTIQ